MNRLKQLRESKGMTQQELADLIGVTKGAVIHSSRRKTCEIY